MNNIVFKFFVFIIFIGFSSNVLAQNIRQDLGVWSYLEVEKKLSKKWKISGEYELRLRDNFNQLRNTFVEIKLDRDLPNKWKTAVYFRTTKTPDEYKFRVSHTLSKSVKISQISLKYRLRNDFEPTFFTERSVLRNRLGLQYKFDEIPLKTGVYVEINNEYEQQFFLIDRLRYKGVVKYELMKDLNIELGYLTQRQYHVVEPKRDFVFILGMSYKL